MAVPGLITTGGGTPLPQSPLNPTTPSSMTIGTGTPPGTIGGSLDFSKMAGGAGALQGLGGDPTTAMNNLGNDYSNAYLAALSLNQQNYNNILAGYQQTASNQQAGQQNVMAGYNGLQSNVMGLLSGSNASNIQGINDQYAALNGQQNQQNIDRGLGNTTIQDSTQRGLALDQAKAITGSNNQFAQLEASTQSNLGLAGLNYAGNAVNANTAEANSQLGWMNSVAAPYPSAAPYAALAQQFGASQQANANRGLQAQQLAQQGQLGQQGLDLAKQQAARALQTPGVVNSGGRYPTTGMSQGTPGLFGQNNGYPTPSGPGMPGAGGGGQFGGVPPGVGSRMGLGGAAGGNNYMGSYLGPGFTPNGGYVGGDGGGGATPNGGWGGGGDWASSDPWQTTPFSTDPWNGTWGYGAGAQPYTGGWTEGGYSYASPGYGGGGGGGGYTGGWTEGGYSYASY